jgi:hypothetical protein
LNNNGSTQNTAASLIFLPTSLFQNTFSSAQSLQALPPDLSAVRHSLGCTTDLEATSLAYITSSIYPPRGLPPGLYKSIILSRTVSQYQYLLSCLLFNLSLIVQILLGAAVTAIGASMEHGTGVAILAAANTVNAGLLALMHNSGLPERYKNDWNEFEEVEMWVRRLIETGVVEMTGMGYDGCIVEEVVHEAYRRFAEVKRTVQRNKPAAYMPTIAWGPNEAGNSKG